MNIIIPKGNCKINNSHILDEQTLNSRRGVIHNVGGKEYRLIVPPMTRVCTPCLESLFERFVDCFFVEKRVN